MIPLPPKEVTTDIGAPHSGTHQYYSGSGNDLDNSMTRSVTLPTGTVTLNAFLNYDIETGYDYLYLTVNGTPVHTSLSDPTPGRGHHRHQRGRLRPGVGRTSAPSPGRP